MPYYSERLTATGRWSAQVTPGRPATRNADGRHITLRRVRELDPDEAMLDLATLQARENEGAAASHGLAEDAVWRDAMEAAARAAGMKEATR
jgi:hypothetical protein